MQTLQHPTIKFQSTYNVLRVIFMYIPPNTELPSSASQRVPAVTSQTTQKFLAVAAYY